jgi:Gram-negative bacterial TonB protein C-terminal
VALRLSSLYRTYIPSMRKAPLVASIVLVCSAPGLLEAQRKRAADPPPNQFVIASRTFFDFGPPFDFYELLIVRTLSSGTSVERILVTPPGYVCFAPAKVETALATLDDPVATLFGPTNPCSIPEKDLSRERKRCKKCAVFSGAHVVMQVQCGDRMRLIRSDILDRDMFDSSPNTPKNTSWTMHLLEQLDQPLGPTVMERPMFGNASPHEPTPEQTSALEDLALGKYDHLFPEAPEKVSDLYRASKVPIPSPTIRLVEDLPVSPEAFALPSYPPLAKAAHVQGTVWFTVEIDSEGDATGFGFLGGPRLLQGAVEEATKHWRFPKSSAGQRIQAFIEFKLNCPK